jgi:hypothetical protein
MFRLVSIFLCFVIFFLTGCSSVITRTGYTLQDIPNRDKYCGCYVPIKKDFVYNKNEVEILGEIKSGDSGFTLECGKGHTLNLFRQEACALKADLINITYERDIDLLSTCYRAKAQFLRFKDRAKAKNIESDLEYT